MDKRNDMTLIGLGLIAGGVAGFIAGKRVAISRRMPNLATWQRELAKQHGEVEAAMLAARVQARYNELYAGRPRFAHHALRDHLEKNILPGLALYQILRAESDDQEAMLTQVETLFKTFVVPTRNLILLLARLPNPFAVFRVAARQTLRKSYPPQGWEMQMVEDSDQCVAFDVFRCFYLDVLTAYGAPELTPLYCKLDDLIYESLPPTIGWERTKTLGRGDDRCDFCWQLILHPTPPPPPTRYPVAEAPPSVPASPAASATGTARPAPLLAVPPPAPGTTRGSTAAGPRSGPG